MQQSVLQSLLMMILNPILQLCSSRGGIMVTVILSSITLKLNQDQEIKSHACYNLKALRLISIFPTVAGKYDCVVRIVVWIKSLVSRIVFAGCCWQCPDLSPVKVCFAAGGWEADQWGVRNDVTWSVSANERPGWWWWPGMQTLLDTTKHGQTQLTTHGHTDWRLWYKQFPTFNAIFRALRSLINQSIVASCCNETIYCYDD